MAESVEGSVLPAKEFFAIDKIPKIVRANIGV